MNKNVVVNENLSLQYEPIRFDSKGFSARLFPIDENLPSIDILQTMPLFIRSNILSIETNEQHRVFYVTNQSLQSYIINEYDISDIGDENT